MVRNSLHIKDSIMKFPMFTGPPYGITDNDGTTLKRYKMHTIDFKLIGFFYMYGEVFDTAMSEISVLLS